MDGTVEALGRLSESRLLDEITESVRKRSRPNIFRVFPRALRVESLHSDVLRWLLDPQGWHEFGDRCGTPLLRQFLKRSHPPKEKEDDGLTSDAEIAIDAADAEIPVGGGTIDIVLRGRWGGRPFVLGIENKIDATEGRRGEGEDKIGQLQLYADALYRLYPDFIVLVALLTPEGRRPRPEPTSARWASLTYEDVAVAIATALHAHAGSDISEAASTGRVVAADYMSIIRSHVMGRDDEITKQCWALFEGHREAWRAIRARLPSERDEAHKLLGDVCCSQFASRFHDKWIAAVRHDKYATLSRPSWTTAFGGWNGAPLVTFSEGETPPVIAALHFRLALEVGDDDKGQAPPTLAVRIKCDTRSLRKASEARQESLVAALRELFGEVKGMSGGQFTIGLGQRKLKRAGPVPEVNNRVAGLAAEAVFEWFSDEVSKTVTIIDRAAGAAQM
jgi:PD-(D/E)XK nuclease superfamily